MPLSFPPQELMPLTRVVKTADQTVNNSTTLVNDSELVLPVEANSTYKLHVVTIVQGSGGNTVIKVGFTYPTGTSIDWTYDAINEAAGGLTNSVRRHKYEETGTGIGLCHATLDAWYEIKGIVITGGTAGNLQLQFAQNAAVAQDTEILARSFMELIKTA